eukprot:3426152-Pleurochrysis_carterae.AAC.1
MRNPRCGTTDPPLVRAVAAGRGGGVSAPGPERGGDGRASHALAAPRGVAARVAKRDAALAREGGAAGQVPATAPVGEAGAARACAQVPRAPLPLRGRAGAAR